MKRLKTWAALTVLAIALAFAFLMEAGTRERQAKQILMKATNTMMIEKIHTLEILGVGVTFDRYRQEDLWHALLQGNQYASVREQDAAKYPWSRADKESTAGGRNGSALQNGARATVHYWGVPTFNAEPPLQGKFADTHEMPRGGLATSGRSNGMGEHLVVIGPRMFAERPDRIIDEIFRFFDENRDVPYVYLTSMDGVYVRDTWDPSSPSMEFRDGYYIPEMPDSAVIFVLARPERVDNLRPFAFEDLHDGVHNSDYLNTYGVGRRLFLAYLELKKRVGYKDKEYGTVMPREPHIEEWLPEAAKFAQREDIRNGGWSTMRDVWTLNKNHPPKDWKPTPWFPIPWSNYQLELFDELPHLGYLHRPVFIPMVDAHGKKVIKPEERQALLLEGWQHALSELPDAKHSPGPTRIVAATGGKTTQLLDLHGLLRRIEGNGGPEFDGAKLDRFVDMDRRLGNTGAATLFMGMAIGVLGNQTDGRISAAINLRDPNEASIVFISPPPKGMVKGATTWGKDRTTLPFDPKNYENEGP